MRIPANTKILVPGLGMYTYETLAKDLKKKIADFNTLLEVEEPYLINEEDINVFVAQWKAIGIAVNNK
jgi:hypothetical protein